MDKGKPEDWAYGTVLRDNLDGDTVILLSAEKVTQLHGTMIGPPEIMWNMVFIEKEGAVNVIQRDEAFVSLFFQERLA